MTITKKRGSYKRIKGEKWIIKHRFDPYHQNKCCDKKRCTNKAVAVWYSDKRIRGNEWYTCEKCQKKDFKQWLQEQQPETTMHCQQSFDPFQIPSTIDITNKTTTEISNKRQAQNKDANKRLVTTIKYREKTDDANGNIRNAWSKTHELLSIPNTSNIQNEGSSSRKSCYLYNLRRGGTLKIYPNLLSEDVLKNLDKEAKNCGLFRHYQTQAQDEPRVHCLLHENATDDFEAEQPGYRYANIKAKAHPLSKLPLLEAFSKKAADMSKVKSWNIGVNLVLYRGKNDSMGEHADDDQGERVIFCLIVSSPKKARRIRIVPKAKGDNLEECDECIELFLSEGDAYEMDGEMQKHYFHSVPKTNAETNTTEDSVRLCIVFRAGNDLSLKEDSGRRCDDPTKPPERPPQTFGQIQGLAEREVYRRTDLFRMGAHQHQQGGISGNRKSGADAIIVSGRREDGLECDKFDILRYAAEKSIGGVALVESCKQKRPVRVFRSSKYNSKYRAVPINDSTKNNSTLYRYDGLYKVISYESPADPMGAYVFTLQRLGKGSDARFSNVFDTASFYNDSFVRGRTRRTTKKRGSYRRIKGEKWIIKHRFDPYHESKCCDKKRCTNKAVAVWYSDKRIRGNEWYTCEKCQKKDFKQWLQEQQPETTIHRQQSFDPFQVPSTIDFAKKVKKVTLSWVSYFKKLYYRPLPPEESYHQH